MRKTPDSVVPISLGRLRQPRARDVVGAARERRNARPVRVLVVEGTATDRQRICRVGQQAASSESQWIEAPDLATAARAMRSSEIDFVILGSPLLREGFGRLETDQNSSDRQAPLVVILSEDEGPQQIQQILDSGAACLLSRRLPPSILASELRVLVEQSQRRLAGGSHRPIPFPKVSDS